MKTTWILITSILFLSLLSFATEHDIIKAAKAGDALRVKSILETTPELVKITDNGIKATALHWAAMYGRKDVVRIILTYNPDVNTEEAHAGTTMHWAAHYDDAEVIEWIMAQRSTTKTAMRGLPCSLLQGGVVMTLLNS